ncbi:MAG TPA: acetylglutamate kinase [Microthrixaceae bacterium]|jgi:acetylglutamate kinase|nr:acetylglutamate kinase [Microthrixaceae bacterium]HMT23480.1 acetylglutamate kinase [Microthrixaceae bacterium]HMT62587.1 acetylglutamate kinase [Microthrixaceae bacterium]
MNATESVDVLLQALPYIQRFHGRVMVIKFGGNAMTSPELFDRFAEDIVLMHSVGIRPVIVHGGGPQIGEWLRRLGKSSEFVDGQRVTDSETLEVVQMVLIGKVNSDIVSALNVHGPVAVGLSGQDAGLIEAEARHPDLGFVGDVTGINPTIIERLLAMDLIPVVSTVGSDSDGQAYNINADAVASAIAEALGADKLIFLTDVPGLLADVSDTDSLITEVSVAQVPGLVEDGTISGGMVPKIAGCVEAIDNGVAGVHLIDGRVPHVLLLELFTDRGVGTMVTP